MRGPSHGFVAAASATSAVVAVVVSELLRRLFARKVLQRLVAVERQIVLTPAGHVLPPLSSAPSPREGDKGIDRRHSAEATISEGQTSAGRRRRATWAGDPRVQFGIARQHSAEVDDFTVRRHTEDVALRALNADLMDRGRSQNTRAVGQMFSPQKTRVVRIALTGGPCAGKSSALEHLIENAKAEGFDVMTAPEVATLYLNTGYSFPSASSDTFGAQKFAFQKNILKLQLQMERCYSDLGGSTGRPTIVVFDRGLRDCRAFMSEDEWPIALAELDKELPNGPNGRITDDYTYQRYDGVIHLVTAADGCEEGVYKFGVVEDDTGGRVYRRETPAEAIEQDRKLQQAWQAHPRHVVVTNVVDDEPRGFAGKLEEATEAVLAIARLVHPKEAQRAKKLRDERSRSRRNLSIDSDGTDGPATPFTPAGGGA